MPLTIPMKFILCLSLLLTGLQVHCHHIPGHHEEQEHNGDESPPEPQQQPPAQEHGTESIGQKILTINNDFALRLYKRIASDPASQNIFISPLSISTAFVLLTLGAKGETHHQIFNGLGFNLSDPEENEIHGAFNRIVHTLNQPNNVTQMNIGNALFIEESLSLQPKFHNDVKTFYEAEGFLTNFKNSTAAENKINDYVKNKTNGKITQAVQDLDADILMVLLNYISFKGRWEKPFDHELTKERDFFVDANTTVKVNMMYRKGYYDFLRDEELSCWVVKVPYEGDYSAWFILPDQGKLKVVEDALTTQCLSKWSMSFQKDEIKLYIPKFTISGSYDVKELLQKEGVKDVFNNNADLSGITGHCNLKVSKAVHKAVLDVHEAGTEAAAITVIEFAFMSARFPPSPIITFDRPFLMFIANKRIKHFIFLAKVINPTAKKHVSFSALAEDSREDQLTGPEDRSLELHFGTANICLRFPLIWGNNIVTYLVQAHRIQQSKRQAALAERSSLPDFSMKAGIFLVIMELCAKMCSSSAEAEVAREHEQQSILPVSRPFNNTDKQYRDQNVADPAVEDSTPVFSIHNFTERNTNFGFDLYRKISLDHDNNIFISPLSLSFVLAVFAQASRGETHDQIVNSLNLHLLDDQGNRLPAFFNQLRGNITKNKEFTLLHGTISFVQKGIRIKEVFHNLSKEYFDMELMTVDFHNSTLAKNAINQHIKLKTKGKIPTLFDTLDQQAKIILVDYIHFGGKWLYPFSAQFTELESFYVDNYNTVQVPMMFKTTRVAYTFDKNLHSVVLKIPYRGSAHMLIAMPQEGDVHALEDFLSSGLVKSWLRNMITRKTDIYFPKFKLDQKYYMHQLLKDLGIKDLFSNQADLSLLTDQTHIKVSQVLQRACIEVDEAGTEAAAGTGSEITPYSMPPVIRVNRPFIFMIYEETTNALLFVGRVTNPTEL
ncbi:uncharacterized protein LOC132589564 [Heteronotia binoei]|uniref:uncharacterized protein LOC132589564 n=1 Tax=Heteronotia binoei TaxID=13085 RepID=UPI00292EDA9A|nr:uncharacterized protein LOC132589564 [Heteronotia binoei]